MWTNSDKNEKAFTSAIIALILFCIFEPFLIFWLGYFCGWLAKIFIGSHLVEGLNLLHISNESSFLIANMMPKSTFPRDRTE